MKTIFKEKRVDKLAIRLYRKFRLLTYAERKNYDERIFYPRQDKLWRKAHELHNSANYDDREKAYRLRELYFKREMAWNGAEYLLVVEDWLKDAINEIKIEWQKLKEDLKST